jgi:hypothetical protein
MNKKTIITLRCTSTEKKILKKLAHRHELTLSEYLRFKGLTNSINNN